jgi:carbonic anhydrase
MKKLIQGIIQFRKTKRQDFAETFSKLALGQKPDALFFACSDSRMAVNVFASTDPGDLFVVRNVGNLVPPYGHPGGTGTAAAVDFAIHNLRVGNIIVCGHSDCGAMHALCQGPETLPKGALREWLEMGATGEGKGLDPNEVSRRNVLAQLEHLKGYPSVSHAIAERRLGLHGIWFDIRHLDVLYYEEVAQEWTLLDETEGERIMGRLERQQ